MIQKRNMFKTLGNLMFDDQKRTTSLQEIKQSLYEIKIIRKVFRINFIINLFLEIKYFLYDYNGYNYCSKIRLYNL